MPSLESRLGLAVVRSRSSVVNQRPYAPSAPVFWTPGVTGGASSSDVPPGARFAGAAAALAVQSRRRAARRLCVRRSKAADEENAFDMDDIDKDMDFGEESNWDDEALPLAEDEVEDWDQEGTTMRFAEEDEDMYDKDWDEEAGAMRFEDDMDGDMYNDEEDWDEGYSMPFEEEDPGPGRSEGAFVGSVFDGMDEPASSSRAIPSYEELSLLYDDFPVQGQAVQPAAPPKVAVEEATKSTSRSGRTLEYMEEREYQVTAEGIAIRTLPDERSPRTGEILRQGETFTAIEAVDGLDSDQRLYLRLPEGRGWVFNDEKIYPGMPSVKLISEIAQNRSKPEVIKRPLVAVVGRPNVGKSTLVNRICDIPDVIGGITHDEVNVTHDRTYKPAEHTDDCGDTYLFDVIDAGGLVFEDSLETVTFAKEIKFQIDVALREACAAVMVVDGNVGVTDDDMKVAKYLKDTYISRGLRVVLAVAKCDRLETMDIKAADFWQLGLGEPIPLSAYHRRGTWELMDALINKGCNGLFPQKSKDQWQRSEPRDNAIKVAICGKPNAGKSSLFNALVGEAFPTQSSSSQGRAFLEFTWDGMGRDLVPPAAVLAYMKTAAEYGDSSRTSRRYFPKTWTYPDVGDFQAESAMPDAARTKFSYHLTLGQNGDPVSQVNANIGKTKEEWNKLITTEMLPYFHKVQSEQVEFYYASTDIDSIEINSTLFNDLLMAIGSIAFVILYLRIHTGGWVVSISSFLIIFISVPLAYIMTPAAKATIASFLSVFLITGIGCDVVFVFTDFWEQGHKLPMESRVMWMIVHGGESCLATSMTTALSFFANLASALQPLREFGMFMGLCVMCAFFLVLLMIPPLLVAIERRKEMVKLRVVDISSGQGVAAYEEKKKKKKDGVMNALLFHLMNGIARCPCMVVLTTFVFFITAAVGVVVTAKLSTGVPDIFPPSHNQVANKAVLDLFSTEANLQYPAPSSGLICNADTVNGTDTGNCQLHWCEAVSDGLGSTTTTSTGLTSQMSCWRSPTLKLDGSTKISIGYSTEGCWDVNIYARVAMEQVSNAAFNRTLVLALEDELGPAGYTHLPPSVSSLRPLIVEKWEDGSVEAVKFWQARTFTATAPFRGQVDVRNTTEDLCELHVLCFKEEGYQCGISGWKRLGSAAYPLARRLSPVFAPFSRRLQGELVTQTVPTPVDVTVIWGIRSARSTPLVGPPSEFWSYDPNFVPQNPWAQRAIRNMCSGLTKNLKVFRAKCWISLFETYLNQQNKRFPSRTFDGDVIGWYYSNTVEAQAHLWFQDRKVIACKLQFLVNVGIYVPSSQGLLYMKEWDSFVEGKNAVASMTANRAWHTASIWVRSEAEVAIIGSTIDTIIIATCSGWAGVFLFTGDLWLAVIVTCVVIVVITGLAFYISCIMAWSIGPIEVISLVVFVGYSVTYALHIAHNYNQMRDSDKDLLEAEAKVRKRKMARAKAQAARKRAAAAAAGADEDLEDLQAAVQLDLPEQELRLEDITFTPAQLREARTRVAVLHVGGATLSSALSTAGSSAFLLLCTLTIFVKLGGVVVAVTVLSILGAIVTLPAALMLVGPAPDAWYKQKVRRLLQMLMGGKAQDQEPLLDSDLGSPSPKDPSELY